MVFDSVVCSFSCNCNTNSRRLKSVELNIASASLHVQQVIAELSITPFYRNEVAMRWVLCWVGTCERLILLGMCSSVAFVTLLDMLYMSHMYKSVKNSSVYLLRVEC